MLDIKCNGLIYRLPEDAEILDWLDMKALEVLDDPDSAVPGKASMRTVHTRDTARLILERFERLLESKGIAIPCADPAGQAGREARPDSRAPICGTEYSELLDGAENDVIDILEDALNGAKIVRHVLSGRE